MNSNNKAVVEKNNQKYNPIEPASNSRRFLWAICGVLAATVIIGAVISGNMTSTTSVSKFNEVSTEFSPEGYLKKTTGPVKPVIDGEDVGSVSPSVIVVDAPTTSNSKKASAKKSVRKDDPVDVGSVSPSVIVVDAPTTSNSKKASAKKSSAKKSVRKDDPVPENDDSIPIQTDDQTTEPSKAPSDSSVNGPNVDEPSASPNGQSVNGPNVDEPSASPNGQSVNGPKVDDEPSASPNGQSVKGPRVDDEPSASPNSQGARGPNDIFGATLSKSTVAAKTAAKETKPGGSKKDKNPKSKSSLRQ